MAKKKENLKENGGSLKEMLLKAKETLRALRFNTYGSKSKNVKEQATLRKEIARMLTELNKNK
jgi:ribosomal protein L29